MRSINVFAKKLFALSCTWFVVGVSLIQGGSAADEHRKEEDQLSSMAMALFQEKLGGVERQLAQAQEEKRLLEEAIKRLHKELETAYTQNNSLTSQLSMRQQRVDELEQMLKRMQLSPVGQTALPMASSSSKMLAMELSEEVPLLKENTRRLEVQLAGLRRENAGLTSELENARNKWYRLEDKLHIQQGDNNDLEERLRVARQEKARQEEKVSELLRQVMRLQLEFEALSRRQALAKEKDLNSVKREEETKKKLERLQKEGKEVKAQLKSMTAECQKAKEQLASYVKKSRTLSASLKEQKEKNDKISRRLKQAERDGEDLLKDKKRLKGALKKEKEREEDPRPKRKIQVLTEENQALKSKYETLNEQFKRLKKHLKEQEEEGEELKKNLRKVKRKAEDLEEDVEKSRKKNQQVPLAPVVVAAPAAGAAYYPGESYGAVAYEQQQAPVYENAYDYGYPEEQGYSEDYYGYGDQEGYDQAYDYGDEAGEAGEAQGGGQEGYDEQGQPQEGGEYDPFAENGDAGLEDFFEEQQAAYDAAMGGVSSTNVAYSQNKIKKELASAQADVDTLIQGMRQLIDQHNGNYWYVLGSCAAAVVLGVVGGVAAALSFTLATAWQPLAFGLACAIVCACSAGYFFSSIETTRSSKLLRSVESARALAQQDPKGRRKKNIGQGKKKGPSRKK